ncbi:hypothetical protein [Klebsiella variicola]|uniref:hypothetical protein n=1 Tax=Klebsiella variicola TaxID=244366 RepID=UPI0034DE4C36
MGMFSKHGSSTDTSDTHSTIWNSQQIEDFLNSLDTDVHYDPYKLVDNSPAMQAVLDYYESGKGFTTAESVINAGKNAAQIAAGDFGKLKGITGKDLLGAFSEATQALYGGASDFMAQQDQAIEDQVSVQMGQQFAQNATAMNAAGGTVGSSALNNSTQSILSSGYNSIVTQESKLAASVLGKSASIAGRGISGALRGATGIIGAEGRVASGLIGAGGKMFNSAVSNLWNAGLVDTARAQKEQNMNRHNSMVNGNTGIMEDMYWLEAMLQAGGIDTDSTNTNTLSY